MSRQRFRPASRRLCSRPAARAPEAAGTRLNPGRVPQLEAKSGALEALQGQFAQLRDDFRFNLGVLDERDAELASYETAFRGMAADVAAARRQGQEAAAAAAAARSELSIVQERCAAAALPLLSAQGEC